MSSEGHNTLKFGLLRGCIPNLKLIECVHTIIRKDSPSRMMCVASSSNLCSKKVSQTINVRFLAFGRAVYINRMQQNCNKTVEEKSESESGK